jgi:hypothetical protein
MKQMTYIALGQLQIVNLLILDHNMPVAKTGCCSLYRAMSEQKCQSCATAIYFFYNTHTTKMEFQFCLLWCVVRDHKQPKYFHTEGVGLHRSPEALLLSLITKWIPFIERKAEKCGILMSENRAINKLILLFRNQKTFKTLKISGSNFIILYRRGNGKKT